MAYTLKLYVLSAESHNAKGSRVLTTEVYTTCGRQRGLYEAKSDFSDFSAYRNHPLHNYSTEGLKKDSSNPLMIFF